MQDGKGPPQKNYEQLELQLLVYIQDQCDPVSAAEPDRF